MNPKFSAKANGLIDLVLKYQELDIYGGIENTRKTLEINSVVSEISKCIIAFKEREKVRYRNLVDADEFYSIECNSFVKALKTYDVEKGYTFLTYYSKLLYNDILMHVRKYNILDECVSIDGEIKDNDNLFFIDTIPDTSINFVDNVINKEYFSFLLKCISLLDDRQKYIFKAALNGLTQADIAIRTDISRAYVSRILKNINSYITKCKEYYDTEYNANDFISNEDIYFLKIMRSFFMVKERDCGDYLLAIRDFKVKYLKAFSKAERKRIASLIEHGYEFSEEEKKKVKIRLIVNSNKNE